MKDIFALFDVWTKLTEAGKAEALEHLRALGRGKAQSGVAK